MEGISTPITGLDLRPLNPHFGVEIVGLDLREDPGEATRAALRAAFRQHRLLLLREQDITTEHQTRFAEIFGPVQLRERNRVKSAEATAQHVSNVRKDGVFGTGDLDFHSDQLFQKEPLSALILYALEVPVNAGGDTRFSDSISVLDRMPAALRERAETLHVRQDYTFSGTLAKDWNVDDAARQTSLTAVHPMVWRAAPGDRGAMWVNKLSSVEVVELPGEEGKALMTEMREYLYDPAIIYDHVWKPGDLVLWDNRRLQHARTPYDETQPRTLRRSPIL
jgi:alpha-ketoglutarate-dependent taurine dioxygenase